MTVWRLSDPGFSSEQYRTICCSGVYNRGYVSDHQQPDIMGATTTARGMSRPPRSDRAALRRNALIDAVGSL